MDETKEPTEAAMTVTQSDDFIIEDLEERFVQQGKWNCSCSSTTCDCSSSCCFYIF